MVSKQVCVFCAFGVFASACVEKEKQLTAAEREQVKAFIQTEKPSPKSPLNIDFDGKVKLLGYEIDNRPSEWKPGQTLDVTWYWHAVEAPGDDWKVFTHLASPSQGVAANRDGGSVVRDLHQPFRWKAGQFIVDKQKLDLPREWKGKTATVYVGLWKGNDRMTIKSGPNDGDDRARAFALPVSSAKALLKLPQLTARKAETPPQIDGKLDGPWATAAWTDHFVNTMNGADALPKARTKVLFDDAHIYFGFEVEDDYLKSEFENDGDHLWKADCVEVMLDPGGDAKNYFELQVSPKGKVFSTRYDTPRKPQPFGHTDWKSEITTAVDVRGKVGDDEEDQGYTVEIKIPWSAFATGSTPANPPKEGDTWRINFFVMDSRDKEQRAVGWSPPRVGDFHTLNRFGLVRFGLPQVAVPNAQVGRPTGLPARAATGHLRGTGVLGLGQPGVSPIEGNKRLSPQGLERLRQQRINKPASGESMPTEENPVSKVDIQK